ncbi:ATP-dependent Clp protease ATP-binding subunit [Eubacterium oxidoreducens]|uniref:ATP-dependent Clp protease ATP-binding subunit ClpC n=1 Tax=Eubacterium oxidoreducens TaxID=1732 RepID=A0A1G6AH80_EUBOX|nr:ATP-dependent Clp protease ATP-binding subunit [Eubacterium oxidoreducens]SDB07719.1 ATP-dependent Clp protease ATP-binding subunit ClpC [Eubacterium oxidoreducens]
MQSNYTKKAKKALELAKRASKNMQHNYIGSEHILLGLIREETGVAAKVLEQVNVEEAKVVELIEALIAPGTIQVLEKEGYTPKAQLVLETASRQAERFHSKLIGTEHILLAIILENECVASRLFHTLGVNAQKIFTEILLAMGEDPAAYKDEFQNGKPMKHKSFGNTPLLDQYSRDLTKLAKEGSLDPVFCREAEINRVIQILSRRGKNNPCLIGEPGVGKTAIVEGLAQMIVSGLVPDSIAGKRLVTLDLSAMVAGSKYRGEFEERIKRVIAEVVSNGNVLLFLDEIHTIIGAGGAEGAIDASNILKPSLARGEIQLLGATTINEYHKYIEKDPALERRFQPVTVEEPTIEQTIQILEGICPRYEAHHGVTITPEALQAAAQMSARYINDRFLPDKAIDVVDEAAARTRIHGVSFPDGVAGLRRDILELEEKMEEAMKKGDFEEASALMQTSRESKEKLQKITEKYQRDSKRKKLVVDENAIAQTISDWTKIPVRKLEEGETARLRRLEKTLHKRVIGQNEAVMAVSKAVRRGRVGIKAPNRPIGSFLFLGPTGVGKTEISKALAEAVFSDEKNMIRVDMSEYMEKHSVSKMIGSPPGYVGYEEGGQLAEKVRRNPYSVLLFDEIEKAHPDVFNVLLQILDDGHVTDAQGRKVDFKNTIIIMTSNAGAQSIVEPKKLGFGAGEDEKQDYERMKSGVMEEVRRIFKPEFLNRIDDIIVFHALNKDHMKDIMNLMTKELIHRCKEQMDITINIKASVKKYICDKAFDPKYGARPLRRMIQTKLEDELADEVINGVIKRGDTVDIGMKKGEIVFEVRQ